MKYIFLLLIILTGFQQSSAQVIDSIPAVNHKSTTDSIVISGNISLADSLMEINYDSLGKADAKVNYHKYKTAGTVAIFTGLLFRVGITAAMYFTAPLDKNLNYPDTLLMRNETYSNAYVHQARKIKRRKIRQNFAIGFGVLVCVVFPSLYENDFEFPF